MRWRTLKKTHDLLIPLQLCIQHNKFSLYFSHFQIFLNSCTFIPFAIKSVLSWGASYLPAERFQDIHCGAKIFLGFSLSGQTISNWYPDLTVYPIICEVPSILIHHLISTKRHTFDNFSVMGIHQSLNCLQIPSS